VSDFTLASLFIVLKDHDNMPLRVKQTMSQSRILRSAAEDEGFAMNHVQLQDKNLKSAALWMTSRMDRKVN